MSFDEDNNEKEEQKPKPKKSFFGLEMSDGVVYTVVIILTLIFLRQVSIVLQALN
ncbi:MAG: hypothetical protein IIC60_04135 [Proteobacteria bacterium]|nr:hypothetical protein [Pseudomonadota bacterium]